MEVVNMDGKCKQYKKAGGLNESEEAEYFICGLPNLDPDKDKLKVQCQGDINKCENFTKFMVCTRLWK